MLLHCNFIFSLRFVTLCNVMTGKACMTVHNLRSLTVEAKLKLKILAVEDLRQNVLSKNVFSLS